MSETPFHVGDFDRLDISDSDLASFNVCAVFTTGTPRPLRSDIMPAMIVTTQGVCGGNARIAGTRIPVWGLARLRRMGLCDAAILERYPALTADDLLAAWDYIESSANEIEQQIRDNEEC